MRAMGPVYMSRRQKSSLCEPQNLQKARETFTAAKVQKFFAANDNFAGGTFNGVVEGVDGKIAQEDGAVLRGIWYRIKYEDGDNEHIQWAELKELLISLPGKDEAEGASTPAVVTKPKRNAGGAEEESAKKQKLSPADEQPAKTPQEGLATDDQAQAPTDVQFTGTTKGTRSKRQRTVKSYAIADQDAGNDENDCQVANTPMNPPTAVKKLRILGPTPHSSQTAIKREPGKSTVKREHGKSTIKKELERFLLEDRLTDDGSPGQLHKVKLVNFMCHEHFEMDFCPHINFVSGTNGSGKSAVLQAIQQVLGVRASATNRASTQKEFIRKGAHEALISVTLWNKGEDAYQPEKWGNFITIDRRIGNSCSWSMKDAKGRKREENRASLDGILDGLNLNGSNPIAVMTQDISRSFLAGSNEKSDRKKFDIYMDATLLAQSQENYQIAHSDLQKIADSVNQAQDVYKQLKARREELGRAVEALKLMDEWQDEEAQVMSGLAWATVGEMEPRVHQLEQSIEHGVPGKLLKIEACLGPAIQKAEELEKVFQAQLAAVASFNADFERIGRETKALQEVHRTARTVTRQAEEAVNSVKEHMGELTATRDEVLASVKETQQSQDFMATQAQAQQLQEQLTQQQQSCEAALADEQAKDHAYREAGEALRQAIDQVDKVCQYTIDSLVSQVKRLEQQEKDLQAAVSNKLNTFGPSAAELLEGIEDNSQHFHRQPVGPLGHLMSLSDNRWGVVVENLIGITLETYVVHDHHDYHTLKGLWQHLGLRGRQPLIVISNFDVPLHTIPARMRAPPGVPCLLDVLGCTDSSLAHVVMNQVIDRAHPEKAALCQSRHDAEQAAAQPGVYRAFVEDGSKVERRGQTSTHFPGRQGVFARLGGDLRHEIQRTQADLAQRREELAQAHVTKKDAVQARNNAGRTFELCKRERKASTAHKNAAESQFSELMSQSQMDAPAEGQDEGDIEKELRELNQQLLEEQQQLMTAQAECDRARRADSEAQAAWDTSRNEGKQLEEDNGQNMSEIETQKAAVEDAKAQQQYYQVHQQDTQQKLEALKGSREEYKRLMASNVEKAEKVCSREEGDTALEAIKERVMEKGASDEVAEQQLSTEALTQALAKLRAKMTNQEKQNGGKGEDILLKHAEVQSQCKEHKGRLQRLQNTYFLLRTACDKRMSDLHRIDRSLEESVNARFNFYMFKKGHTGMIKVKRATEGKPGTLEIKVRIGGNGANTGNVKDLKQLSGGEKSYTTVAFALALGEWTQSPFRAMDEFDVFMDAVNRRVAMENLFSNSLEQPDLQFIFLTPQDVNAVEEAKKNLAARGTPLPEGYCKVVLMRSARE